MPTELEKKFIVITNAKGVMVELTSSSIVVKNINWYYSFEKQHGYMRILSLKNV